MIVDVISSQASYLFHIEPISIGTPYIESITSYIKRVAIAHSVSVGNFMHKEIIPNTKKDYLVVRHILGIYSYRINALYSDLAKSILGILEEKTCNNLLPLSMGEWMELVNPSYMLSEYQNWCPLCFQEMKDTGQPLYEPMIWNFRAVETCLKHNVRLASECPHCHQKQFILNNLSRVGFCNSCNLWLGSDNYKDDTSLNFDWQQWVNNNIGLLLSTTSNDNKSYFKENISNLRDTRGISLLGLSKEINIPYTTIKDWAAGKKKPELNGALILSYKLGYSTIDILTKAIKEFTILNGEVKLGRNGNNKININELKKALDETISSNEFISLKKFSMRMGISMTSIKRHFPKEASILKKKYSDYLNTCKLEKKDLLINTINSLNQRNIYPSRKKIIRELGGNILSNNYYYEIWRTTLERLGYKTTEI